MDKLTRSGVKGSADSAGQRVSWVRAVGEWTYAGRAARAGRHLAIAARAPEGSTLRRWHEGRANGQLERIDRVEDCGSSHYQLACKSCGVVADHVHERTCSAFRYCVECRGRRARQYRERIAAARDEWLSRKRTFERERFLTVTVPHCGVAGDVTTLLKSWERFTRGVRRWVRRRWGANLFAFVRALEIAPSDGGHAHMHAWVGSPFLPHAVLRVLWGRALSSELVPVRLVAEVLAELPDERSRAELLRVAGWRGKPACDGSCYLRGSRRCRRRHYVPWPVLDIRLAYGDVAEELVKYLIKDVDQGELVDPLLAANMIEATEGVRLVAASRGFWVVAVRSCEHCNEPAVFLVLTADVEALQLARGPPRLRSYSGDNSAVVATVPSEHVPF